MGTTMRIKRLLGAGMPGRTLPVVLLSLSIAATSCGIFDTRDSNPPDSNGGTPRVIPIDVDAVLTNFGNAVAYGDQALYEETLDQSFQFVPDPADRDFFIVELGEDIFADWGRDEELTAIRLIFSDSESLTVSFFERDRNVSPPEASVRLDFRFRQRVSEDSIATFRGLAEIHLIENNSSMWSIDKWEETITTEFPTWGRLKGNTAGG
jgi:hypothetical protein